jgi:aspartate-semialdehyde dehydrogenase
MQRKIQVGILGGTGMVGQHFARFLEHHPWFDVAWIGASDRSAGKKYRDAMPWLLGGEAPSGMADIVVAECKPDTAPGLVFSALDAGVAAPIEQAFARAGHAVVSNSRNHRLDPDVPLLVPEINPTHLQLVPIQQKSRGWQGLIVTNPNCSTVVLTMSLAPLRPFGIKRIVVTTLQAISGAGYPGVASMDIVGNVIPFIAGEEEKIQRETRKILGEFDRSLIHDLPALVSAHCNRVPVVNGHLMTVSVEFGSPPPLADLQEAFQSFAGVPQERGLPSAPPRPVRYMTREDRPQPRLDVEWERGMTVSVGRLRPCPVFDFKFVAMGHNTVRGAAGAAVLNAELLVSEGLIRGVS